MSIFRINHVQFERTFNVYTECDTLDIKEWENTDRLEESGWKTRYDYEAELISFIINQHSFPIQKILEIGSGPGVLSQCIQKKISHEVEYHLIDKPYAKQYFDNHKYKGTFFVKDFSMDLDTKGLLPKYDLIICNDTLEHLLTPTNTLKKMNCLMDENSLLFISVPNWRMAHQFLYRGLWDYDNFLYFMHIHKFEMISVYPSPLQTPYYPKLNSEESMPDELIQSWNFYFVSKKII